MPCRQAHVSCFSITLMMIVREQALGAPETLTQEIALAALPCSTASGPNPFVRFWQHIHPANAKTRHPSPSHNKQSAARPWRLYFYVHSLIHRSWMGAPILLLSWEERSDVQVTRFTLIRFRTRRDSSYVTGTIAII